MRDREKFVSGVKKGDPRAIDKTSIATGGVEVVHFTESPAEVARDIEDKQNELAGSGLE